MYTVGEIAKKLNINPSTIRYYDSMGLLPFVERSDVGVRIFKDSDLEWIKIIICLKNTGMRLDNIKKFIEMAMKGDSTIEDRLELILKQKAIVSQKIEELKTTMHILEFKEWYYTVSKKYGTTEIPRNMSLNEIPEKLRKVKLTLSGE